MKKKPKNKYLSSRIEKLLEELDWNCSDQIHQYNSLNLLHWYSGSFITAIPGNIIEIFSNETEVIWDPFCGSGITAVESYRMNRKFYGNDINEISTIISLAKIKLIENFDIFRQHFKSFKNYIETKYIEANLNPKKYFSISNNGISYEDIIPWYSENILKELLFLHHHLKIYKTPENIKIIYLAIFLNIAKLACAQQKTWGHIADNVLPNKKQTQARQYNFISSFVQRVAQVIKRTKRLLIFKEFQQYKIVTADSRNYRPGEPIDLVVTSPPYPFMNDYTTAHRIGHYWLNISNSEINELKKKEIGARYRRHTKSRFENYYKELTIAFENIISCLKDSGILAVILPEYPIADQRSKVINMFYDYLNSKLTKMYHVPRDVDLMNRWAPFRSLRNETLTIWCKDG